MGSMQAQDFYAGKVGAVIVRGTFVFNRVVSTGARLVEGGLFHDAQELIF
jgi:hypothetical protein